MKHPGKSMLEGPLLSSIISYTIPIILTSMMQLAFNSADMIVVGQFCGNVSLAAVSATGSVTALIVTLFMGLSVGVSVTVAHGIGSKDETEVHNTVHTALPTALIFGALLTVLGFLFSKPLLRLLDTPESVFPLSDLYLKISFSGVTFSIVYNYCAAILRAAGDTRSPLIFLTISGVINVALNVLLVTVIQLDVAGVALATVVSQALSALLVVLTLMRRSDCCKLIPRKIKIYKQQLFKIVRIGLPAGLQSSLFSLANSVIQSSVNSFGEIFMSGNAAAANIESYVYLSINAFSQASVNFVGQNFGAKQFKRIWRITVTCLACVLAVGVTLGQLANLFGTELLMLFLPNSSEGVAYGLLRVGIVCTTYFLCGLMDVVTGSLRGMGASVVPTIVSLVCICGLRIGWIATIFQIPQYHTPEILYTCYPLSWIATFVIEFVIFLFFYSKYAKILNYRDKFSRRV